MGQVVYTGSISGNHNLNANGSDSVTVNLSQSGSFPSQYTVTKATLYLGKFYCYSTSKGVDLFLNGSQVNDSEMCGSEVTEQGGGSSYYSISGTWNLSTSANYENVSSARIVSRSHSSGSTGVMNLRDGCQVKITVEYTEGSSGGGNTGDGDEGGDNTGGGTGGTTSETTYGVYVQNVHLSNTVSAGQGVTLSFDRVKDRPTGTPMSINVRTYVSTDLEHWEKVPSDDTPWYSVSDDAIQGDNAEPPYSYAVTVYPPETPGTYYQFQIEVVLPALSQRDYSDYSELLLRVAPALSGYTDDPIVPGETPIKAVHMTELQSNTNAIREAYRLSAYDFSKIVAGETSLGDWTMHVMEIRDAIDEISKEHDAWISITENKPSADVIMQLRNMLPENSNQPGTPESEMWFFKEGAGCFVPFDVWYRQGYEYWAGISRECLEGYGFVNENYATYAMFGTKNEIDLSGYNTLFFDISVAKAADGDGLSVGVDTVSILDDEYGELTGEEFIGATSRKTVSIDISNVDSGYVVAYGCANFKVYNIWCE